MYVCETHGGPERSDPCPACMREFETRRNRDDMTGDERVAELERIIGQVTIPTPLLFRRINELVGRTVFTHELSTFDFWRLREEARTDVHPSPHEVLGLIPPDKRVVVVEHGDDE